MNHQVAEDITDKVHAAIRKQTTDDELIRADEELIRADDEREKRRIREDREAFDREHPGWRERQAERDKVKAEHDEALRKKKKLEKEIYEEYQKNDKLLSEAKARQLQRQKDAEDERRRADPVWIAKDNAEKLERRRLYKKNHTSTVWGKIRETMYPTNEDNMYRKYPNLKRAPPATAFLQWMTDHDPNSDFNTGFDKEMQRP
jgi:hypothetical protein